MDPQNEQTQIKVVEVSPLSPHSKAIYEAGKSILIDSLETSREFCKSMIGTSAGAIPVYLGILAFILPEKYQLGIEGGLAVAMPAVSFLVTSMIFAVGYLPDSGKFSLDIIDEIEQEREKIILRRRKFVWSGLVAFVISTLWAIFAIVINIGVR